MHHQNKLQFAFRLASGPVSGLVSGLPARLVYFAAEVPKFSESEIASVKNAKETEGPELDTAGLVQAVNANIDKHADQLKELPPEFLARLHNEIVNYFLQSPGRFEKDDKKGLSAQEFAEYRSAMIAKAEELIREYAPTQEEINAKKEALKQAQNARETAESIRPPAEREKAMSAPGTIQDLGGLNSAFQAYNESSMALQQGGAKISAEVGEFQRAYAAFEKARNGLQAYKKFASFLGKDDPEMMQLQDAQARAKAKVEAVLEAYRQQKTRMETYGREMAQVSSRLKQEKIAERDQKIQAIESRTDLTDAQKIEMQKKYQVLEAEQTHMMAAHQQLQEYQQNLEHSHDAAKNRTETAKMKQDQLRQFQDAMQIALARIEEQQKNPALNPEQKQQLEATKQQLLEKSGEAKIGLSAADQVLQEDGQRQLQLGGAEKEAAEKSLILQQHLDTQVGPGLASLEGNIAMLEGAKMEFATSKEQIMQHYEKAFASYDAIDKAVDDAVAKNNLANEQMIAQLEAQKKMLDSTKIDPPRGVGGFIESYVGANFAMLGGAISAGGEWIMDQANSLSQSLERARGEMHSVLYVVARIGVEIVNVPIGVAGGLTEMIGGIVNMAAHPVDTLKGFGTLFGLNPDVSAGTAWKEMGKALISLEDFKHGRIGVGIGKLFVNIVTTATGAEAAESGGVAAKLAYAAAREAGEGAGMAFGQSVRLFAKGAARGAYKELASGVKGAGKFFMGDAEKVGGKANLISRSAGHLKSAGAALREGASTAHELGVLGTGKAIARGTFDAGKAGAEFAGKSFRAMGENMAASVERLWKGERYAGTRLRGFAREEAALAEELGKSAEKYEEFQKTLESLRRDNPGLGEAQLRHMLAEQNLSLMREGLEHEAKLQKLALVQEKFGAAAASSARETHYVSEFSRELPPELRTEGKTAKKVGGWIDKDGKINYSSEYFEEKFGVKLGQKDGENIFIIESEGKGPLESHAIEMSPKEFFATDKGRLVLAEMKKIKTHEVTHRLLEFAEQNSSGGLGKNLQKIFENNEELRQKFLVGGGKMEFRNVQEFLCEIAEGRRELSPQALAELEAVIGREIPAFSFEKVRKLDTKKLRTLALQEMQRSFVDAMDVELKPDDKLQAGHELEKAPDGEKVLASGEIIHLPGSKFDGKLIMSIDLEGNVDLIPNGRNARDMVISERVKLSEILDELKLRENPGKITRPKEVLAIGDVHGDAKAFVVSLKESGYVTIDPAVGIRLTEKGKGTILVQTGDIFDRGEDVLQILDQIKMLKSQGADIRLTIGNHELMALEALTLDSLKTMDPHFMETLRDMSDLNSELGLRLLTGGMHPDAKRFFHWYFQGGRDVLSAVGKKYFPGRKVDIADLIRKSQEIFLGNGEYAETMRGMKAMTQIDDVLYVHAGIDDKWAKIIATEGVEGANQLLLDAFNKNDFRALNSTGTGEMAKAFWIRREELSAEAVAALQKRGIKAIVHGHDQIDAGVQIARESNGILVINNDVGMSRAYNGHHGGVTIDRAGNVVGFNGKAGPAKLAELPTEKFLGPGDTITCLERNGTGLRRDWKIDRIDPMTGEVHVSGLLENGERDTHVYESMSQLKKEVELAQQLEKLPQRITLRKKMFEAQEGWTFAGREPATGAIIFKSPAGNTRSFANVDEFLIEMNETEQMLQMRAKSGLPRLDAEVKKLQQVGGEKIAAGKFDVVPVKNGKINIPGYKFDGYTLSSVNPKEGLITVLEQAAEKRGLVLSREIRIDEIVTALENQRNAIELNLRSELNTFALADGQDYFFKVDPMTGEIKVYPLKNNTDKVAFRSYPNIKALENEIKLANAAQEFRKPFKLCKSQFDEGEIWQLTDIDPETHAVTITNAKGEKRSLKSLDHLRVEYMITEATVEFRDALAKMKVKPTTEPMPEPMPKQMPERRQEHRAYTNIDRGNIDWAVAGREMFGRDIILSTSEKFDGGVFIHKIFAGRSEAIVVDTAKDHVLKAYVDRVLKDIKPGFLGRTSVEKILQKISEHIAEDFQYQHKMRNKAYVKMNYGGDKHYIGEIMSKQDMVCRHMGLLAATIFEKATADPLLRKYFPKGTRIRFMSELQEVDFSLQSGHAYAIIAVPAPEGMRYFAADPTRGKGRTLVDLGETVETNTMSDNRARYLFSTLRMIFQKFSRQTSNEDIQFLQLMFRREATTPRFRTILQDAIAEEGPRNPRLKAEIQNLRRSMRLPPL